MIEYVHSLNFRTMEPLLVFIAKVRPWHVFAVGVFALTFAIVGHLTDKGAISHAARFQQSIFSIVAIPLMITVVAFLIFATTTRQFGATALFPSIFIMIASFVVVGLIGARIKDPELPSLPVGVMGLVLALIMSGLLCAFIALRHRLID